MVQEAQKSSAANPPGWEVRTVAAAASRRLHAVLALPKLRNSAGVNHSLRAAVRLVLCVLGPTGSQTAAKRSIC